MNFKHGMRKTRLYRIWCHMKSRCYNKNNHFYNYYGGRGIEVCEEWHDFTEFMRWSALSGYDINLSIERIDVNKGYYPENCCWIPRQEQSRNKRKPKNNKTGVVGVTYDGVRFRAGFYNDTGKYVSKSFSTSKYGDELAFCLARDWRKEKLNMLKDYGINYGEEHYDY